MYVRFPFTVTNGDFLTYDMDIGQRAWRSEPLIY